MRMPPLARLGVPLLLAMAMLSTPAAAQDMVDASKRFIQDLADRAIQTASADLPEVDTQARVRELLYDGFAVRGIARFVLGRYWRRITPAQQEEYLTLFEEVVVGTSADRLSQYSGQRFEIVSAIEAATARPTEQAAIVRSRFHLSEDSAVRVDWRVARSGDIYKITDVILEGASLANTYRDEFAAVIRRRGIEGLLDQLRSQREALAADKLG